VCKNSTVTSNIKCLSSNRTQSSFVIGLLTEHNTLRRHLYVMGLSNNRTCRKCGTEEETSVHNLCECEALVSLRHTYLVLTFSWPCISVYLSEYLTNLMHKICFTISFISCLYMFRAHALIIRRSKLHYTSSGIITPYCETNFVHQVG